MQTSNQGGLKIWECTYDLLEYIIQENIKLETKLVLDLGCGVGIIGLIALLKGSFVHFQDYVCIFYYFSFFCYDIKYLK